MKQTLRDMHILNVGNVKSPASVAVEIPFTTQAGSTMTLKRFTGMYYFTFTAKDEYTSVQCVIMYPDFAKVTLIHDVLEAYMDNGDIIATLEGDMEDDMFDVKEVFPKRYVFL